MKIKVIERAVARKRSKNSRPVRVDNILNNMTFARKGRPLLVLYQLQKSWRDLVGSMMGERSYPKTLHKKILTIAVENPAWAQQFSLMKEELKDGIKKKLNLVVEEIRFVTEKRWEVNRKIVDETDAFMEKELTSREEKAPDTRSLDEVLTSIGEKIKSKRTS